MVLVLLCTHWKYKFQDILFLQPIVSQFFFTIIHTNKHNNNFVSILLSFLKLFCPEDEYPEHFTLSPLKNVKSLWAQRCIFRRIGRNGALFEELLKFFSSFLFLDRIQIYERQWVELTNIFSTEFEKIFYHFYWIHLMWKLYCRRNNNLKKYYPSIHLFIYLSINLSIYLAFNLSIHLFIYSPIHLFTYLLINLSI